MELSIPVWFEWGSLITMSLIIVGDLVLAYRRPHIPSVSESGLWVGL